MSAVLALCDEWDALSKGETATTAAIREAYARDLNDQQPCGIRSLVPAIPGDAAYYTEPCIRRGPHAEHADASGLTWQESVR